MEIVIYYLDHKQLVKNAEIFNTCSQMPDYLLVMEQYQQKTEVNLTQNGLPQLQDLDQYHLPLLLQSLCTQSSIYGMNKYLHET